MFCPKCKGLMFPRENEWVCGKCNYKRKMEREEKEKKIIADQKKKSVAVVDKEVETLPTDDTILCPKCESRGAYWMMQQTRAADEPETRFYICKKCGHRWREY